MTICVNTTEQKDGYCLPYAGGGNTISVFVEYLSGILMIASFIIASATIVLSFKLKRKRFFKWKRIDRFVVYEAANDMAYYLVQILYIVHVTIEQKHYPEKKYCTVYACLTNVFGLSQTLMTVSVSVLTFMTIYYNKKFGLGKLDCFLHVPVLVVPVSVFLVVGALGQLGPNGFYCNFDGIKGRLSHLIITSVGNTVIILVTAIFYTLICLKIYKESKRLEVILHTTSVAERRAFMMAKHFSLLILAFFVQFGMFIIDGIWFAIDAPPPEVHHFVVLVGSFGGVVNGIVFYTIRRRENKVLPIVTSNDKYNVRREPENINITHIA